DEADVAHQHLHSITTRRSSDLNEVKNIARCLESLRGVADEVIVLDSYSDDQTGAIAAQMGARVFQKKFDGYGEQKAAAISHATQDRKSTRLNSSHVNISDAVFC